MDPGCVVSMNRVTDAAESRTLTSDLCTCACVSQVRSGDIETEKRLRKDLKRTKALLADAQIMLDHIKNNAPSKREIAQLKNQVLERTTTPVQVEA